MLQHMASSKVVQTDHIAGILATGQRLGQQRMGGKVVALFHQAHKAVQGIAAAAIAAGGTGLCRELSHHIPHDLPQAVTSCHKAVEGVGGVTGGVQLPEGVAEPTVGVPRSAFRTRLGDFVAHTVQNDTGMVGTLVTIF